MILSECAESNEMTGSVAEIGPLPPVLVIGITAQDPSTPLKTRGEVVVPDVANVMLAV